MLPEVNERSFGMRGPNVTPAHPIALALVTISRLSLTLSPGGGSHALRCNRHALIMQMSLGRAGPLLMSDWHVYSSYIERRNASRLTVHLIHARALRIDDRASFSTPPLSFLSLLPCRPRRSCLSPRPRVSLAFFLPTAYCAASAISVYTKGAAG